MKRSKDEYTNYLLATLGEECGEVQQMVGKALRFGLNSVNPITNVRTLKSLVDEMHDILAVWYLLLDHIDEDDRDFKSSQLLDKRRKVQKFSDLEYYTE